MAEKSVAIAGVCAALNSGVRNQAISLLKRDYPFAPQPTTKRQYGPLESTRVFVRDGFLDRYTSERLIFPPVLHVISAELPDDFPYHPNWKTDVTHSAYWEVGAIVDHLLPVSRGGADDDSNWVTTLMAHNSAKGNWTLAELGWSLQGPGDFRDWDDLFPVVREGSVLRLEDCRGKPRELTIARAESAQSAYVEQGTPIELWHRGRRLAQGRVAQLPPVEEPIRLRDGDHLLLTAPGEASQPSSPVPHIGCTLSAVFRDARVGERIFFDDGKIEGLIRRVIKLKHLEVEITRAGTSGAKLRSDKGINLRTRS